MAFATIDDPLTGTPGAALNGTFPVAVGVTVSTPWSADPNLVFANPIGVQDVLPIATGFAQVITDASVDFFNGVFLSQSLSLPLSGGATRQYEVRISLDHLDTNTFKSAISYMKFVVTDIGVTVSLRYSSNTQFVDFPDVLVTTGGNKVAAIRINYATAVLEFVLDGLTIGTSPLDDGLLNRVTIGFGIYGAFNSPLNSPLFGGISAQIGTVTPPVITYEYSPVRSLANYSQIINPFGILPK